MALQRAEQHALDDRFSYFPDNYVAITTFDSDRTMVPTVGRQVVAKAGY